MDEFRRIPLRGAGAVLRRAAPAPALCGFLVLLVLIFTASYAVGDGVGPVAPGMHGTGTGTGTGTGGGRGDDMGDMDDMPGGHG
ncbi:hypothetical protein QA811_27125 [Streptomyces sp. B21-102]|uniref:hypothetical protein n=1 Tax=unclassified Streptomyces TaxID=2593676 RepID=UPI002FF34CB6